MAKSKNPTNAVPAVKKSSENALTQKNIPAKIQELKEKLAELKGEKDETVSTNIVFDETGENIKDVKTVGRLLQISAAIRAKTAAFEAEAVEYGVKNVAPYAPSGKSLEEWKKIIAKAIKEIVNDVQIKTLETAIKDFSEFLSTEAKMAMKLESIQSLINKPIK